MDIKKLLNESNDFQVIYKNFPILSDNSVVLAKYAIVISEIDHKKFLRFLLYNESLYFVFYFLFKNIVFFFISIENF